MQGKEGDPIQIEGYFPCVDVRDGDTWKCRMQTWNIAPAPAPAQTKLPRNTEGEREVVLPAQEQRLLEDKSAETL